MNYPVEWLPRVSGEIAVEFDASMRHRHIPVSSGPPGQHGSEIGQRQRLRTHEYFVWQSVETADIVTCVHHRSSEQGHWNRAQSVGGPSGRHWAIDHPRLTLQ